MNYIYILKQKEFGWCKVGKTTNPRWRISELEKIWGSFDLDSMILEIDTESLSTDIVRVEKTVHNILNRKKLKINMINEYHGKDGYTEFFKLNEKLMMDSINFIYSEWIKNTYSIDKINEISTIKYKRKTTTSKYSSIYIKKDKHDNDHYMVRLKYLNKRYSVQNFTKKFGTHSFDDTLNKLNEVKQLLSKGINPFKSKKYQGISTKIVDGKECYMVRFRYLNKKYPIQNFTKKYGTTSFEETLKKLNEIKEEISKGQKYD